VTDPIEAALAEMEDDSYGSYCCGCSDLAYSATRLKAALRVAVEALRGLDCWCARGWPEDSAYGPEAHEPGCRLPRTGILRALRGEP
jgi:hypothetical protein